MRCPRCQFENPATAKFCLECGLRQATVACRQCRTELPATARFCLECGTPVSGEGAAPARPAEEPGHSYTPRHLAEKILTSRATLEGERKLVTVLFCDVSGSTALAERIGAEAMHALLDRFFKLAEAEVHRYEGTVNQFLGDGFMALFGAPVAHEDHARRAVLAAWAIQRRLAAGLPATLEDDDGPAVPVTVRMGINTGHVVVGKIGDNLRMDYTAIGDATNLAARLQQHAEPGVILLSEATGRLVQGDMILERLEAVRVKGKTEPVTPYRLVGPSPARGGLAAADDGHPVPFVGRKREMALLREHLEEVDGGHGRVVEVMGEAGIGKSRLLLQFCRELVDRDPPPLVSRCLSHGATTPYLPVAALVEGACGILDSDAEETVVEKVRVATRAAGLTEEDACPLLLRLLGVTVESERLRSLSPEAIKQRTFEVAQGLARGPAGGRGRVLVVDDLQWIDETSQEWLTSLVERIPGAPILLLVSYRPGYEPPWTGTVPWRTALALGSLSPVDALELVHAVLRPAYVPDAVVADIIRKADGNPLFLAELARAVAEGGPGQAVAAPNTVQGVLLARIDRLPEASKQVLQAASVLGPEFPRRLVRAVAGPPGAVDHALDELVRLEFLVARPDGDDPIYAFRHGLTQEVVYATLLTPRRHALHAAAGRTLEEEAAAGADGLDEWLAHHFARSEQADKAVLYLTRVAGRAAALYAYEEAARAMEDALVHAERLAPEGRERRRLELVLDLALYLYYLGRLPRVLELLLPGEAGLEGLADAALAGRYYVHLARTYSLLGRQPEAARAARRALEAAEQSGELAIAGTAHHVLAFEAYCTGESRRGLDHARRAAALLEAAGERAWVGMAQWAAAMNHLQLGEFDAVLAAAARGRAIGEELADARLQSYAGWIEALARGLRGDREEAVASAARSLDQARDPFNAGVARGALGYAYLEQEPGRAMALLERAVREMGDFRLVQNEGLFMAFLSRAYFLSGNLEHARSLGTRALEIARASGFRYAEGRAQRVLGQIAQRRGALGEAAERFDEALRVFRAIEARFEVGLTHLALSELAHTRWDPAGRAAQLRAAHALFAATGAPRYLERVERRAAEVGVSLEPRAA